MQSTVLARSDSGNSHLAFLVFMVRRRDSFGSHWHGQYVHPLVLVSRFPQSRTEDGEACAQQSQGIQRIITVLSSCDTCGFAHGSQRVVGFHRRFRQAFEHGFARVDLSQKRLLRRGTFPISLESLVDPRRPGNLGSFCPLLPSRTDFPFPGFSQRLQPTEVGAGISHSVSDRMYLSMNIFLLTRNCDSDGPNGSRELREFNQVWLVACFYINMMIAFPPGETGDVPPPPRRPPCP